MNREQRRKAAKEDKKRRREMWPGGVVGLPGDLLPKIPAGETFTIAGLRRLPDGTFDSSCKPGDETVFTAGVAG